MRAFELIVCICLAAAARPALATPADYSEFELRTIGSVLGPDRSLEPEPEGKEIEAIEIVTLEVFDENDPVPDFVNVFHATSRKRTIARELLFEAGTPYDAERVAESARNLRDIPQLSLVLIVPVRGSAPDKVRVVVITRDVWSLRLNWAVEFGSSGLSYLYINPTENNLLGLHTTVGALFLLEPDTYSLGLNFAQPRIADTRLETLVSANLVFNRETGEAEGSFGTLEIGQPLYSLDTEWAWGFGFQWRSDVERLYEGSDPVFFDARSTRDNDLIPIAYDSTRVLAGAELVRSFGRRQKYDLSVGFEVDLREYDATPPLGVDPEAFAEFVRTEVPVSDTRLSPFVQLRSYTSQFVSRVDFETLALQEDFRLGHEVVLRLYPAASALGSSRDMLGMLWGGVYTLPLGDGLVRGALASTLEYASEDRHDAQIETVLRVVSPRLGFGRIVADSAVYSRYLRYLNRERFALGGDSRPRGYAPKEFRGHDALASTVELRTRPVDIWSAQVGLATFYDIGAAADSFDELELKPSVGLGLRMLLPQFNRLVFRVDWGFPLAPGYTTFPGGFFATFGQAFAMPGLSPVSATADVVN